MPAQRAGTGLTTCGPSCCASAWISVTRLERRRPASERALRDRGRQPADPRPRLVGPDGSSVELPEPMFDVLL